MRLHYIFTAFVAAVATMVGSAVNAAAPEKPATIAARTAAAHIMSPGKLMTTKRPDTILSAGITNTLPATAAPATKHAGNKSAVKVATHAKPHAGGQPAAKVAAATNVNSDATKLAMAPQSVPPTATSTATGTTTTTYSAPRLPNMQPLNAVVNTAPVNPSESETKLPQAAITPNSSNALSHPMVLTPAPAYEVATPQEKNNGKMAKIGGWFNQRVLRRGPGAPSAGMPPATVQAGPASYASANKPAASPYLIASENASTVTYWPPTSTNVAVHNFGPMSESAAPGATASGIPSDMRPAILIVKLAPGIYPAAIGGVINKVHGSVMGSHGAEYMHTLRIAVNRNDVPLAMKLLTNNRAVQYVVPEELLGVAGANK
ncbi:MAG: hypothetical protein U0105_05865 [Candidatus Obscuribacterales bacterium]